MIAEELMAAIDASYKELKADGQEGEENLHFHGFLDGWGKGCEDCKKALIDKFFKWIEHWGENGGFGYEGWDAGWEEDLRKFMEED